MADTYWNGEPVDARRCRVIVGHPLTPALDTRRSTGGELIDRDVKDGKLVVIGGEPVKDTGTARKDPTSSRRAWYADLVGTVRYAVEVKIGDLDAFYLDDQGYTLSDADLDLIRQAARAAEQLSARQPDGTHAMPYEQALEALGGDAAERGSPGWGWAKVTGGLGLPEWGSVSMTIDRVIEYLDDDAAYDLEASDG